MCAGVTARQDLAVVQRLYVIICLYVCRSWMVRVGLGVEVDIRTCSESMLWNRRAPRRVYRENV